MLYEIITGSVNGIFGYITFLAQQIADYCIVLLSSFFSFLSEINLYMPKEAMLMLFFTGSW